MGKEKCYQNKHANTFRQAILNKSIFVVLRGKLRSALAQDITKKNPRKVLRRSPSGTDYFLGWSAVVIKPAADFVAAYAEGLGWKTRCATGPVFHDFARDGLDEAATRAGIVATFSALRCC